MVFAEFTGRAGRVPGTSRRLARLFASRARPIHAGSRAASLGDRQKVLSQWPIGIWAVNRTPCDVRLLAIAVEHRRFAAMVSEFALCGENPEVGLCLEVGLPN